MSGKIIIRFRKLSTIPIPWLGVAVVLLFAFSSKGFAQGYRIVVEIRDIPDTVLYLANYYGDKTYLTDTAYAGKKNRFVFEGDHPLPGGIYILAGQSNTKYLEIIVDQEQRFTLYSRFSDLFGQISFEDSKENVIFYRYIKKNVDIHRQIAAMNEKLNRLQDKDSVSLMKREIQNKYTELNAFQKDLAAESTGLFVSELLTAMSKPDPQQLVTDSLLRLDSIYMYQIYKKHFWDNIRVDDDRMLRTPIYHKRLQEYFGSVVYQQPDSIIVAADEFIASTETNPETFKYAVWYLTYIFETSKIMGFDEIFVHMVDAYYSTGKAVWSEESVLKTLEERADALRPILIGNTAPNLILLDTLGGFVSLYSMPAPYTLVLFYEADCSHCRREIAKLKDWDANDTLEFKVFAVCTDTSLTDWKKFIRQNELHWIHVNGTRSVTPDYHDLYNISVTPTIFLLDERKKIIAKRLSVEQLKPFLAHYARMRKPGMKS